MIRLTAMIVTAVTMLSGCETLQMTANALTSKDVTASSQPMFVCGSFTDPEIGRVIARPCAQAGL